MSGSRTWSAAPQSYAAALGVVAGAMVVRFALNPILGNNLHYFLQFVAILAAARYFGFWPSVAGLTLATADPVYRAISIGRNTPRFWWALAVAWVFCLAMMWLLDRQRRMRTEVEQTSRLADERLQELG